MSVKKNPRKATPRVTKTTNKAEFEALRKELLPSDFDYLLATAKTMRDKTLIRDIRRIVAGWRKAGLPTVALIAVIDAAAESSKAGGDEAAMKIAIQAAFDKTMGDGPHGGSDGTK